MDVTSSENSPSEAHGEQPTAEASAHELQGAAAGRRVRDEDLLSPHGQAAIETLGSALGVALAFALVLNHLGRGALLSSAVERGRRGLRERLRGDAQEPSGNEDEARR